MFSPATTRIGWIGTGVMGSSMCAHLLSAGYRTTVHNRTPSKLAPLLSRGAVAAAAPRPVAAAAARGVPIVGSPTDVRAVTHGPEGTLSGAQPGTILVDMTTSEPALAAEIAAAAKVRGVHAVDAPVSGGDVGAREARLSIMVGGDPEPVAALAPLFALMGKTVVHQGPPGAGQHAKMVNQILIASTMVGVCEAMLYARRSGLDPETVLRSVSTGAAGSWSLTNLAPRMIAGRFEPGFFIEHFLKDMGIALAEARGMDLDLPGLALAEGLYREAGEAGHLRDGTHALVLEMARRSGVEWRRGGGGAEAV